MKNCIGGIDAVTGKFYVDNGGVYNGNIARSDTLTQIWPCIPMKGRSMKLLSRDIDLSYSFLKDGAATTSYENP